MRTFTLALIATLSISIADAQLVLPWSGTDPTATLSSFQIIKSGTSGRANTLYITNAGNASDALLVNTIGLGKAGYFQLNNTNSSNTALRADSNGSGTSVVGLMTGTGRAGTFRISNTQNTNYALYVASNGSGPAVRIESVGNPAASVAGNLDIVGSITTTEGLLRMTGAFSGVPIVEVTNSSGRAIEGNGTNIGVTGSGITGVYGISSGPAGRGVAAYASASDSRAIEANATSATGVNYGAYLMSHSNAGTGVVGYCPSPSGVTYGMKGNVASPDGFALYAVGRFTATGTKAFQIDHPLNPQNEFLNHYCTEAPEPLNAYSGNTVTDSRGFATVVLPDYFESINRDVRYTLTVIDKSDDFVLAKITQEVKDNQFVLRTNKPRVKVSWRVEATRNDRWVQKYGYQAEQAKTEAQRGKYVQPELYGQPAEKGIHYVATSPQELPANKASTRTTPKSRK